MRVNHHLRGIQHILGQLFSKAEAYAHNMHKQLATCPPSYQIFSFIDPKNINETYQTFLASNLPNYDEAYLVLNKIQNKYAVWFQKYIDLTTRTAVIKRASHEQ